MEKVNGGKVFLFISKLVVSLKEMNTIYVYYNKLKSLWDEFDLLVDLLTYDYATSEQYVNQNQ